MTVPRGAVWTRRASDLLRECHAVAGGTGAIPEELLRRSVEITDSNAAFFDVAHNFAGCIAGLHEVLRRQGLLEGIWCLDPHECLSRGQREEIDRVYSAYPHLNDDIFIREHRDQWLKPSSKETFPQRYRITDKKRKSNPLGLCAQG
jgi:hypothetical protein